MNPLLKACRYASLLVWLLPFGASGQNLDATADSILTRFGETYVTLYAGQQKDFRIFESIGSVCRITDDSVVLNITRSGYESLLSSGLDFTHTPLHRPDDAALMVPYGEQSTSWDFYPTWQGYDSIMVGFQQLHPSLCTTHNILTLASGRKLLLVRLTSAVNSGGIKPLFLYSATIHGDETAGYNLMLRLIDHLLTGYGTDPEATWLLDNLEIWICPLANPDGTYNGGNNTVSGAVRRNANLVDLNRNYPDPRVGANPDGKPYQPETMAFMGFADTVPFTMGANLHGGAEVVNYPWDTWYKLHPDDSWWVQASRQYADTVQANAPSGFFTDQDNGITNGAAWYVITGGRQDYMNYFAHCREVTLEVSNTFIVPTSQLNAMWGYHHRSLINYLKESWYGLTGRVTDSVSGLPLEARIWIDSHDADSSHVESSALHGYYHRPVFQGPWNVTFSATGYKSKSFAVNVPFHDTTHLDVQLVPLGYGTNDLQWLTESLWYEAAGGVLHLPFPCTGPGCVTEVFGMDGRLLFSIADPGETEKADLPEGICLVRCTTPDGRVVVKKIPVF